MGDDLEQRLAAARARVGELASQLDRDTTSTWRVAVQDELAAEAELAAPRGEQYARVIDIGPAWDVGAPLPHVVSNGSRAFAVCWAGQLGSDWDGTGTPVVSPADAQPSLLVVIEMWGCSDVRFGGPNDEAVSGHPLYGKGLAAYRAHEVFNSAWIQERIEVNSAHPRHSEAPFRQLHHYVLLFHDEMLEVLALGIESRLVQGTLREVLDSLTSILIEQPDRRAVEPCPSTRQP